MSHKSASGPTCLRTTTPSAVVGVDDQDPAAGNARHIYAIQYGGPEEKTTLQFQHGPRGVSTSTAGILDDDLFAILQDRFQAFQDGPFACAENAHVLGCIKQARAELAGRVARRVSQGVLGKNEKHVS